MVLDTILNICVLNGRKEERKGVGEGERDRGGKKGKEGTKGGHGSVTFI